MGSKYSLRADLERQGAILPEPGPDFGARLVSSLFTASGLSLSQDTETTAVLNLARAAGLFLPGNASDLSGCLEAAVSVRLAQESDPDGQALAQLYASLWTALTEAGQEIPDSETATANDELANTGWLIVRDGEDFKVMANGEEGGGVRLAFGHAPYRHRPKLWVRYYGPREGEGWKNVATGDVVYGGQQPGTAGEDGGSIEDRIKKSGAKRKSDRMAQGAAISGKAAPHLAQAGNVSQEAVRDAQRPLAAITKTHGDGALSRIEELAHLVGQSLAVLPRDKSTQSARLQQILQILSVMHALAKKGSQNSGGQISPEVPDKPQSPFLPKRGTS